MISRREFLRNTALAALGLLSNSSNQERQEKPAKREQTFVPEPSLQELAGKIRAFEAGVGDRPLFFSEARQYVPLLAAFYTKSTTANHNAQYFADRTFVVKFRYESEEEEKRELQISGENVFENSIVKAALNDYPNLRLLESEAIAIAHNAVSNPFLGKASGFVSLGERIFVPLDQDYLKVTSRRVYTKDDGSETEIVIPNFQFEGFGRPVFCRLPTPAALFRSVILHEYVHLDDEAPETPLEQDVIDSYSRTDPDIDLRRGSSFWPYTLGWSRGLGARFSSPNIVSGEPKINFLAEFATDYLGAKIQSNSGLAYDTAYALPYDYANFASVLKQAGIEDNDLKRMPLREFLLRVGLSAQNIQIHSTYEALDFSALRFLHFKPPELSLYPSFFNWRLFEPYFSGIDTEIYEYADPKKFKFPMWFGTEEAGSFFQARALISCR